jgi:hypothetical protein
VTAVEGALSPSWPRPADPIRLTRSRYLAIAAAFLGLTAGILVATFPGWVASRHAYRPGSVEARTFEDRTGIHLVRVGVTGAGGLLQVTYQILDPSKAMDALNAKPGSAAGSGAPYEEPSSSHAHKSQSLFLLHEESGSVLNQVFHYSSVSHGDLRPGGTYYQILLNPSEIVAPGSLVTVVMGKVRLQHVTVV